MKWRYSKSIRKQLQFLYTGASVVWILGTYALGVYKAKSRVAYIILSFPLFVFALGFLNSGRITYKVEKQMLATDFLAIALLLVTVLFEMYHHNGGHFTINIIIVTFVLLVLSMVDIWTGEEGLVIWKHIRTIARTSSVVLLAFVIYVNTSQRVPMRYLVPLKSTDTVK